VALDDGEHLSADQVLLAGGPWTPEILGAEPPWPPITRTWGVTVQVELADPPRHVLEEGVVHTVNVPSGQAGSLFSLIAVGGVATVGSTFLADQPDPEALALVLVQHGGEFVPALADAPVIRIQMCARPQSVDGRPFIGPVADVEGLFVCAGHGPWGISTGPGSAALVVELILGRPDRVPLELRSDRPA
jgi:D-amino-acid dehydrogenase